MNLEGSDHWVKQMYWELMTGVYCDYRSSVNSYYLFYTVMINNSENSPFTSLMYLLLLETFAANYTRLDWTMVKNSLANVHQIQNPAHSTMRIIDWIV